MGAMQSGRSSPFNAAQWKEGAISIAAHLALHGDSACLANVALPVRKLDMPEEGIFI